MKIIITTSNLYQHLLPVFFYCFNKYFPNHEVTLLGYDTPTCTLPDNVTFVSMGKQGTVNEWSTDIRAYLEAIDDTHVLWMMEDSFLRLPTDMDKIDDCYALMNMPDVGRIALTRDILNRAHTVSAGGIAYASPTALYRLSTQPAIWNKEWLLKWLAPGLTPWEMERQEARDEWQIIGFKEPPIVCNEGVNKRDIKKLDLNGFSEVDIFEINKIINNW